MSISPTLVWFRKDLRLADNLALDYATQRGGPVIPVFIWAPEEEGEWSPGAASKWWLHQSLVSLAKSLRKHGSQLVIRKGPSQVALQQLAQETGADTVVWNRCYEPHHVERDAQMKVSLQAKGISVQSFNANLLFEPWTIRTKHDSPFKVFTPFWKTCMAADPPHNPLPVPAKVRAPSHAPDSLSLRDLALEPKVNWTRGFCEVWQPGEPGAAKQLSRFLEEGLRSYAEGRDRPGQSYTSRLSPHLHFGEISPRQIWATIREQRAIHPSSSDSQAYLRELGWREFAYHILFNFPRTPDNPLRREFSAFPWRNDPKALQAWQRGQTGYPLVDAGMRELWQTGWMHNRVRMVAASFLVKHLLVSWGDGARWFWDMLVDADLANNTLGWQWVAGCGADAAPYFRIFNPLLQGERFDPNGDYVRRWVPELSGLSSQFIHKPWEASETDLQRARVELGQTYPLPIVNHTSARIRALDALAEMKNNMKSRNHNA